MAIVAPNMAACDKPKVKGEASGFLRVLCITQAATDNPAPARKPAAILGNRIFHITVWDTESPCPITALTTSEIFNGVDPEVMEIIPTMMIATSNKISTIFFFDV